MLNQTTQKTNRVLIADDDPVILDIVQALAESEGFTVVTAQDGREAYRILHKDSDFRAVIFDMVMPHLEGSDLLNQMQTEKRLSRIPVIIMSASDDLQVTAKSFEAGAVAFLRKPFTPDHMRNTLRLITLQEGQPTNLPWPQVDTEPAPKAALNTIKVLLIEDNPGEAIVIEAALLKAAGTIPQLLDLEIVRASRLSDGVEQIVAGEVDVVLLDLSLPDSEGLDTLATLLKQGAGIPIVILTGTEDGRIATAAMALGAQDYLVKGQVDEQRMMRAVRTAFETKHEGPRP